MSRTGGRNSTERCRAPASKPPAATGGRASTNNMIHTVGIIMNGVTGRMGLNQHLARSIHAIIQQGGVKISDDEIIAIRN